MSKVELPDARGRAADPRRRWRWCPAGQGRRSGELPDVALTVRGVPVDRAHLAGYDRVCGFRLGDTLPATYPHIMAFPLALRLMTAADFPFPMVGLVHLANRITVARPIDAGRSWTCRCTPRTCVRTTGAAGRRGRHRPPSTGRGLARRLDVPEQGARAAGGERRGAGDRPRPPAASARWRVEPRVGTELRPGLRRPQPDPHVPDRRPAARLPPADRARHVEQGPLPGRAGGPAAGRLHGRRGVQTAAAAAVTVAFSAERAPATDEAGWTFGLHNARSGKPHLTGTITSQPS